MVSHFTPHHPIIFKYESRRRTNTAQNINDVFGKDVVNERIVRRFKKFCSGDFNLENDPREQPKIKMDNQLKVIVKANTSQSTRELTVKFEINIPAILNRLKQISIIKKLVRWNSHELNKCQKRNRLGACLSLLLLHKDKPFLHHIVTYEFFSTITSVQHNDQIKIKYQNTVQNQIFIKKINGVC